jgi:hypothetical protein
LFFFKVQSLETMTFQIVEEALVRAQSRQVLGVLTTAVLACLRHILEDQVDALVILVFNSSRESRGVIELFVLYLVRVVE